MTRTKWWPRFQSAVVTAQHRLAHAALLSHGPRFWTSRLTGKLLDLDKTQGPRWWHAAVFGLSLTLALARAESVVLRSPWPPWPNGQGVGLLIRRLRVRVPQGVEVTWVMCAADTGAGNVKEAVAGRAPTPVRQRDKDMGDAQIPKTRPHHITIT